MPVWKFHSVSGDADNRRSKHLDDNKNTIERLEALLQRDGVLACAVSDRLMDKTCVGYVESRITTDSAKVGTPPLGLWHDVLTQALDVYLKMEALHGGDFMRINHERCTISLMRLSPVHPVVAVAVELNHGFMKSLQRTVRRVFGVKTEKAA